MWHTFFHTILPWYLGIGIVFTTIIKACAYFVKKTSLTRWVFSNNEEETDDEFEELIGQLEYISSEAAIEWALVAIIICLWPRFLFAVATDVWDSIFEDAEEEISEDAVENNEQL